jgi:copper chaperone CopZ
MAYVHAIEGRVRIKIPELKGSLERAQFLESCLLAVDGLRSVSANPTTGNVLILYEEETVTLDDIHDHLRKLGFYVQALAGRSSRLGSLSGVVASSVFQMATEAALRRLLFA